jgi:hypothetical protein
MICSGGAFSTLYASMPKVLAGAIREEPKALAMGFCWREL